MRKKTSVASTTGAMVPIATQLPSSATQSTTAIGVYLPHEERVHTVWLGLSAGPLIRQDVAASAMQISESGSRSFCILGRLTVGDVDILASRTLVCIFFFLVLVVVVSFRAFLRACSMAAARAYVRQCVSVYQPRSSRPPALRGRSKAHVLPSTAHARGPPSLIQCSWRCTRPAHIDGGGRRIGPRLLRTRCTRCIINELRTGRGHDPGLSRVRLLLADALRAREMPGLGSPRSVGVQRDQQNIWTVRAVVTRRYAATQLMYCGFVRMQY